MTEHDHLEKPNEPNVSTHSNNVDSVVGNPFKRNEPHHKSCHRGEQDWVTATGSNDAIGRFNFEGLNSSQEEKLDSKKQIKT